MGGQQEKRDECPENRVQIHSRDYSSEETGLSLFIGFVKLPEI
jgi:hypothetical protein